MIGVRSCRRCAGSMAVAGAVGHLRCPRCRCWLPTGESWNLPLGALALLLLLGWAARAALLARGG